MYGDVLLCLWLFCLCLGCMGDDLLGSMVTSLFLCSMGISPLSIGVSLGYWVLMGSMVDSPLLCSLGISPLFMGVSLNCWWSRGLSVHQLLGSVLLGLDLSGCAGLARHEFSLSRADFLSEMKFKASFSAVSQFPVLVLIQSSKVLKEINLFAFLALIQSWKVLKWIGLLLVSSMVLKEFALRTWCSVSWKETFFLPDLPGVLKEVSLPVFLTVSLTLLALSFSLITLMLSTPGVLKGVNLCLFCSLLPCVFLAGVLKGVSVHVSLMTLVPSKPRVLKWVDLCCSLLPHVSLGGVLKESQCTCT